MTEVQIVEYQHSAPLRISAEQQRALASYRQAISLAPTSEAGTFQLKADSLVGVIELPELTIRIIPKVDVRRVFFLMAYAMDPTAWKDYNSYFSDEPMLLESMVIGLARAIRKAVTNGLLYGYRHQDEALATVRGRIRFQEQLQRRFGFPLPLEVSFDEFTDDILENRILRAALDRLHQLEVRSQRARTELRLAASGFNTITPVWFDARRLPQIHYTRLNQHYRPALELARLVLRNSGIHHTGGGFESTSFLIDMEKVFEDFLVVALREAFPRQEVVHGGQRRDLWLDDGRRIRLEPDITIWAGDGCMFLADAKYKIPENKASNADVYQLLAYMRILRLRHASLVYPGRENSQTFTFFSGEQSIEMRFIDLDQEPDEILRQAASIRASASDPAYNPVELHSLHH